MAVAFHQFGFDFESANQNPRPSTNAELPSFSVTEFALAGYRLDSIDRFLFVCLYFVVEMLVLDESDTSGWRSWRPLGRGSKR